MIEGGAARAWSRSRSPAARVGRPRRSRARRFPPSVIRFVPAGDYIGLSADAVSGDGGAWRWSRRCSSRSCRRCRASRRRRRRHAAAGRAHADRARGSGTGCATRSPTAQVALTLALLFGSALMLAAADQAVNGALGLRQAQSARSARLVLPERPYADAGARRQFIDRVLERMRAIPAVSQRGDGQQPAVRRRQYRARASSRKA